MKDNEGDASVVFDITLSIEELTSSLSKQQEDKVGVKYAYCACGAAVSVATAQKSRKAGGVPRCRSCYFAARRANVGATTPTVVYLCKICRMPLRRDQVSQAKYLAKLGYGISCRTLACKKATQEETVAIMHAALEAKRGPIVHPPCVKCGLPAVAFGNRRYRVRRGIVKALCKGCRGRQGPRQRGPHE